MSGITAHMIVRNEDRWIWFAIKSVLPYVKQILITDTGSTDNTVNIVRSIKSKKIVLDQITTNSADDITKARQNQITNTHTSWIWVVDGDEIYPRKTAKEVVDATKSSQYEGIVVRRYDLLGDIFHRQRETVGEYNLFGQKGHLVTRLINLSEVKGLHLKGTYPNEGYYDEEGISTRARNPKNWYITKNYFYHSMYLKRSSLGSNLRSVFNRSKYKIETGIKIPDSIPEVFNLSRSEIAPDPLRRRSLLYELIARFITTIKNIKRAFWTGIVK